MPKLLFWQIHAEKVRDTTLDDENNHNIIQCCSKTYEGAPHTGKQTSACASDLSDGSHVSCTVLCCVLFLEMAAVDILPAHLRYLIICQHLIANIQLFGYSTWSEYLIVSFISFLYF